MHLHSSDWPYLIYFLLLMIVIFMGLTTRRDLNLGKTVKYASIWLGIAIVLIGLYSYRHDFSDMKHRMLGELHPSYARINQEGKISINKSKNGHFYINTNINGQMIKFMVDTGASDISMSLQDARRAGIDIENLRFNKRYQTANGIVLGAQTMLDEIKIGEATFRNVEVSVNSGNMTTSLLGMSFLKRCKKYEFYRDQLVLTF